MLSTNVTRIRKQRQLSIYMLAKRAGIARSHLTLIEQGRTDPSTATLVKIATALDVAPAELLRPSRGEDH